MNKEDILDAGVALDSDSGFEKLHASQAELNRARFWAFLGGIGGIILAHKFAHKSKWIEGKNHFLYDEESRNAGKKIQRIGLIIWIPLYICFYAFYIVLLISI